MSGNNFAKNFAHAKTQANSIFGEPLMDVSPSWSMCLYVLLLFLIVFGVLLQTSYVSQRETVEGVLRYSTAEARIHAQGSGVIKELNFQDGDYVNAGDVVATLSSERYSSSGDSLDEQERESITNEIILLTQDMMPMEEESHATALNSLSDQRNFALQRLENVKRNLASLKRRVDEQSAKYLRAEELLQQEVISVAEYEVERQAKEQSAQSLLSAEQELISVQAEIERINLRIYEMEFGFARKETAHERELKSLRRQLSSAGKSTFYNMISPISGRLTAVSIRPQETVTTNQFLFAIVPENAHLLGDIYIPSRQIAFVEPDQNVRIKYNAFAGGRYGLSDGVIQTISQAPLPPSAIKHALASEAQLLFPGTIILDQQHIDANGKNIMLQPGMLFEAQIITQDQSLWDWLVYSRGR